MSIELLTCRVDQRSRCPTCRPWKQTPLLRCHELEAPWLPMTAGKSARAENFGILTTLCELTGFTGLARISDSRGRPRRFQFVSLPSLIL